MNTQDIVAKLAAEAGVSKDEAQSLFDQMVPVMGMQLKKNAQTEREKIVQAAKEHAEITNTDAQSLALDGEKILGHVFKDKSHQVKETFAVNSNIDTKKAGDLVKEFAPLVMGVFGRDGLSQENLEKVLEKTAEKAMKDQPASVKGMLSFLDLDKDGSVVDDIPKIMLFLKGLSKFLPKSNGSK